MKTLINISITMLLVFGSIGLQAQQSPMYTHYMYNTLVVNPGYAGSRDALTATLLHRSQWVGFDGAPVTQSFTMHSPLRNSHIGLGFAVMNDKSGPVNNTNFVGDFAYRMQITKKAKLALGLSAGANLMQANLSQLEVNQENDPAFQNDIENHVSPDFGFGIYYSRERFYLGLSTPNLLENSYEQISTQTNGNTLIGKEQRHFFFIAGSMFKLGENLSFKPTTFVKVTAAAPIEADVTASFIIANKLLLGAMFRTGDAFGALIGLDITEQLHAGYSFDWSYGLQTSKYNSGSHEVVLRYDFLFFDKKQIHSPRYF